MSFDIVIGLEVHAQLSTKTKAWCHCQVTAHAAENSVVCEICSAQPGTLPVLNKTAVEYALRMGLATNCSVNQVSFFDRKNYFYPDLPKGYQITQYQKPIAENGFIEISSDQGEIKKIGIERIQMEEDTGKSTHEGESSLINLNRCGTPLIEIVGRPHLSSAKEATQYLKNLYAILTYLDICHGNLAEGNFRCDVNISLKPKGSTQFGTRTEIKNLNSFRNVEKAIETEVERQTNILTRGEKVIQQTLQFDVVEMCVKPMRTKSDAHDYRYIPEPDLMPLVLTNKYIEDIKNRLPELPEKKKARFVTEYNIPQYDAEVLTSSKDLAAYFEACVKHYKGEPKKASNWIMVELLKLLNEANFEITKSPVPAKEVASLLNFVLDGKISGKMAKDVFLNMFDHKKTAEQVITEMGVTQINDDSKLESIAKTVVENHPTQLAQYLGGKENLFGFFVGQVMKETKGQANPQKINDILKQLLKK